MMKAQSSSVKGEMSKDALEALLSLLDNWAALFTLLVVIGVGGELVIHVMQSRANKKLITMQKSEALAQEAEIVRMKKDSASFELNIANAKEGAAEALERAAKAEENLGNAKKSAAEANERAASANERAANAEKSAAESRLALEKIRLPRRLTEEQRARIAAKMRAFTGTQFDTALNTGQETQELLAEIEDTLKSAGWTQIEWATDFTNLIFSRAGKPRAGVSSHSGVVIEIHKENAARLQPMAQALADALNSEGVASQSMFVGTFTNNNPSAIHIIVGEKPR